MQTIEYRVRPVTRYIVTRWEGDDDPKQAQANGSRQIGNEYANAETAYEVGYALCKAEHDRLGWSTDDDRIKYPGAPIKGSIAPIPAVDFVDNVPTNR